MPALPSPQQKTVVTSGGGRGVGSGGCQRGLDVSVGMISFLKTLRVKVDK